MQSRPDQIWSLPAPTAASCMEEGLEHYQMDIPVVGLTEIDRRASCRDGSPDPVGRMNLCQDQQRQGIQSGTGRTLPRPAAAGGRRVSPTASWRCARTIHASRPRGTRPGVPDITDIELAALYQAAKAASVESYAPNAARRPSWCSPGRTLRRQSGDGLREARRRRPQPGLGCRHGRAHGAHLRRPSPAGADGSEQTVKQ